MTVKIYHVYGLQLFQWRISQTLVMSLWSITMDSRLPPTLVLGYSMIIHTYLEPWSTSVLCTCWGSLQWFSYHLTWWGGENYHNHRADPSHHWFIHTSSESISSSACSGHQLSHGLDNGGIPRVPVSQHILWTSYVCVCVCEMEPSFAKTLKQPTCRRFLARRVLPV